MRNPPLVKLPAPESWRVPKTIASLQEEQNDELDKLSHQKMIRLSVEIKKELAGLEANIEERKEAQRSIHEQIGQEEEETRKWASEKNQELSKLR